MKTSLLSNKTLQITGAQCELMSTKIFEESYPRKIMCYPYTQPHTSFLFSQDKLNCRVKLQKADCVASVQFCNWCCDAVSQNKSTASKSIASTECGYVLPSSICSILSFS